MPTSLTDLKQMNDADIVTNLWEMLYDQEEKLETLDGSIVFAISAEEMESMRQLVDELEYRWSVKICMRGVTPLPRTAGPE